MECLPLTGSNAGGTGLIGSTHAHTLILPPTTTNGNGTSSTLASGIMASGNHAVYQHHLNLNPLNHLNLNHNHHHHHHHLLMSHQSATTPYSNNYPLQHSSSHHNIHSDQTKSLQELQHEVGALLEFRDLVIETFPDLKNKMASMSSSSASASSSAAMGGGHSGSVGGGVGGTSVSGGQSVSGTNTLTGGMSSSSLASRREWEPGIRPKRKTSQKEPSTGASSTAASSNNAAATASTAAGGSGSGSGSGGGGVGGGGGDLSSSSLTRSRSNSHSGKKEPKSGGENNGSVVQDSGFSTETSSSKEGHSASSTNGAMTGPNPTNRLSCLESDDELLNLLDVIHRKSNRLREEVEQLQNYERSQLHSGGELGEETDHHNSSNASTVATAITKTASGTAISGLTPKTFREHVERLNKEDIKQLRKERDRLLDKLAEMEAETLTGRIKAAKMSDKVEELISVKKDLEEQLKLAMAQKLELSSRVQQLQQQQQQQSKSSSSQSDFSSQRNFSSTATTVLSTVDSGALLQQQQRRQNTFQPVLVVPSQYDETTSSSNNQNAFLQSATGSDISGKQEQQLITTTATATHPLGRLDGIVSSPGSRNTKTRLSDSKRFAAILLETSVIELQRHLLTLTVQNQVLMQKLEQSTKSKSNLAKRLDKSKEDIDELRFQLEEKSIELEGTKAQLRVLESRIHTTSTPHGNSTPSSYALNSQNDYETNRSSASTTLMLSRRGLANESSTTHSSDMRSSTPSATTMPPPPTSAQISTPSMKAMTHLPMDELQQHSSSTESAHDHELPSGEDRNSSGNSNSHSHSHIHSNTNSRLLMSTSVGGIPVGSLEKRDLSTRRYLSSTKPSKIPLPGSKSGTFFGGKPPTGRPSTANSNSSSNSGRSPNSSTANMSSASSRSSLSRSTGNLLYSKSPNSLKRADSAQSIRNALNTSNNSNTASGNVTVPSTSRILQNSPLPKPKRDSITSRLRNIESVSRHSNDSPSTARSGGKTPTTNLVSSTPKSASSIASQLNSTLRKDLQLSSHNVSPGSQQFLRRTTGGATSASQSPASNNASVTRRFSSASTMSPRGARIQEPHNMANGHENGNGNSVNSGGNSDSDSGKQLKFPKNRVLFNEKSFVQAQIAPHYSHRRACFKSNNQELVAPTFKNIKHENRSYFTMCADINCGIMHSIPAGGSAASEEQGISRSSGETFVVSEDTQSGGHVSMEESSDNLLVTFDYGYSDSIDSCDAALTPLNESFEAAELKRDGAVQRKEFVVDSMNDSFSEDPESEVSEDLWFYTTPKPRTQASFENIAQAFQVHHVKHNNLLTVGESAQSLDSELPEFDVDVGNYDYENGFRNQCRREFEIKCFKNLDGIIENDETDDEEQFYDSIECAQSKNNSHAT